MSRILVIGGLGFIGHNVVKQLLSFGHEVAVLDNKNDYYSSISRKEITFLVNEREKLIKDARIFAPNDISNYVVVDHIFDSFSPNIVIHLASFPNQTIVNQHPNYAARTMIEGLVNVCQASKRKNVDKFVFISSSMVYGDFQFEKMFETSSKLCDPIGLYGILKLSGEKIVQEYYDRKSFDYTIIRPSAVYGPLDTGNRVVTKFILAAMRGDTLRVNGERERLDFTYVSDTANGIVQATLQSSDNKIFNISRGKSRSLLEAAEIIIGIVGKGKIEILEKEDHFPSRGTLDISSATEILGYVPKIDIEEGFRKYYDHIRHTSFWS